MKVVFEQKDLKKIFKTKDKAKQKRLLINTFGEKRAKKIIQRLDVLYNAETLEDVRPFPGKFHDLKHNRKYQVACHLDEPYRMIMECYDENDQIPINEQNMLDWSKVVKVVIIEIDNYHKEK